jgi:phage baseplate assembly protein W
MKTFAVKEGDLLIGSGGHQMITGIAKVKQDISIAIREPFGSDPYHPLWGSLLDSYIGQPINETLQMLCRSEVERVVSNYMIIQQAILQQARTEGRRPEFSSGEVVTDVLGVSVSRNYDTISINLDLRVMDGTQIEIRESIGAQ